MRARPQTVLAGFAVAGLALLSHATTYEVGDGKPYVSIGAVPWESLAAGDTVLIHYRATPYKEKWVICRQGTQANPITVRGVPGAAGELPVIEGSNATTRSALDFWNEARGVIKIGGANTPPDAMPQWIVVENLDIKSGRQPFTFTGRSGLTAYGQNAASIFIEKGSNVTIRGCILRDSGNGLFCASATTNLLVEGCYIYDNGVASSIYEHNNYTEAGGIVFQFNRFGPLRANCLGNNLKDRSGGCVIRWNWIESGNRQLDLVDSDYDYIYGRPSYTSTYVYGNILIEPDGAGNAQICHYGGDSGTTTQYRKGTLHFYNNTVISTRIGTTTLLRLSTGDERCECRNNIVYTTATGANLAILDDTGTVDLHYNWLRQGWKVSHSNPGAAVNPVSGNIVGTSPSFRDFAGQDFSLATNSTCVNAGGALPAGLAGNPLVSEYAKHRASRPRKVDQALDVGALECGFDSDGDGMPDWWEWSLKSNITAMTATSDSDGDGVRDRDEYVAGTCPTNPASAFRVDPAGVAGTNLTIRWPSATNRLYAVEYATNLVGTAFGVISNSIPATPPTNVVTGTLQGTGGFFRIRAQVEMGE